MDKVTCARCGTPDIATAWIVKGEAVFCPICGNNLEKQMKQAKAEEKEA